MWNEKRVKDRTLGYTDILYEEQGAVEEHKETKEEGPEK